MEIDFNSIESLKQNGFEGFKTVAELMRNNSVIPKERGVYLVVRTTKAPPFFLETGVGCPFHDGKKMNYPIANLKSRWIDGTIILNIGKAGGLTQKTTLKKRLKTYLDFGQGKDVPHRGGRSIWQLSDSKDLIICWKRLPNDEPRLIEEELIASFQQTYKQRPFANLQD
jgi:hypothetical protein